MPSVKDAIAQRLKEREEELRAAQGASAQGRMNAGITEGVGQMIAGLSRSKQPFDSKSYDYLHKNAEQPTADVRARQQAEGEGVKNFAEEQKIEQTSDAYDPNSARSKMVQTIFQRYNPNLKDLPFSAADAGTIEKLESAREAALTRREVAKGNAEARKAAAAAKPPPNPDRGMPTEDREVVTKLAGKNAGKIAIANQIDAVLSNWDTLSEAEQLQQGRQLIKVLNSTEGQDAVGVEEARRLGGKLEYALGNFTNSNPMQFGRDLPGFKQDATNTSGAIRKSIDANNAVMETVTGRKPKAVGSPPGARPPANAQPTQTGEYSDAEKEARYQEWKRRQGKQ